MCTRAFEVEISAVHVHVLYLTTPPPIPSMYRPSHTLRCRTLAMGRSKAAIHQNCMRCAAMHFQTGWNFCSRFWNISAIYYPIFKRFAAL